MVPPAPPSPPEGPPRGTNFSRRKATQPLPPSPAFTYILASSTNTGSPSPNKDNTGESGGAKSSPCHSTLPSKNVEIHCTRDIERKTSGGCRSFGSFLGRQNADKAAAAALVFEADNAGNS